MTCTNDRYGPVCERVDAHDGSIEPHRNGLLIWHDPPMLLVDGKPYVTHGALPAPQPEQLLEPDPERFLAGGRLHDPCAGGEECSGICVCEEGE